MPRGTLHWELTPLEKYSIRKIHELLGQQVGRAGVGRVRLHDFLQNEKDTSWPEWTGAGWHHMGTTRMGTDPKQSVVDANCKVHGMANLYCAGSSCYTTAAAVNPTLTLDCPHPAPFRSFKRNHQAKRSVKRQQHVIMGF